MPRSKTDVRLDGMGQVERFSAKYCKHFKDHHAGKPFLLLPWQSKLLRDVFETYEENGLRRYRNVIVSVPKKCGKSTMMAMVALYMLMVDDQAGAEIYSAAVDREQAGLVFDYARRFVLANPILSKRVKVLKYSMSYKGSVFSPRARNAKSAHGIQPSCLILDECAQWRAGLGTEYFQALTAGTVGRSEPLTFMISTAGVDRNSFFYEQVQRARQVEKGVLEDRTLYSYITGAEPHDDWTDPKVWQRVTPSYGVTVTEESLALKCREAIQSPSLQNSFRNLHLNQWTSQIERWLDLNLWDKCDQVVPDLTGRECYGGLDLAATIDLCAFVLIFPPEEEDEPWWVIPEFWLPEDDMLDRGRKDQVPYLDWVRDGYLNATPGNVSDYEFIQKHIQEAADKYKIQEIGFDRKFAHQLVTNLYDNGAGIEMVQMAQGAMTMDSPMRTLEARILKGNIAHGGHPVLRWHADNMTVRLDANANMAPQKADGKTGRRKIDGIVALIMAIGRATAAKADEEYENPEDAFCFG